MTGHSIIIARYGEIHLKGKNRGEFTRALTNNLKSAVGGHCKIKLDQSRFIFTDFAPDMTDILTHRIAKVFGIVSVSPCAVVAHQDILAHLETVRVPLSVKGVAPHSGDGVCSFKVAVNRADKSYPHTSMELARLAGAIILKNDPSARVDVHNPDVTIHIDIREGDHAFIYDQIIPAVGGMPVGTAGRALVMLSGGIDSPVAAYLAAKRGLSINCVHFASPPYTSDLALDKIHRLRDKLAEYCGGIRVHVVPFTEIQKQIRARCDEKYLITIMRRFMVRIAERIGGADCVITGESLAQVASQTIAGITTNNMCARILPILRPLITYDKSEIVTLAKKIGTYDISVEPHPDCCTVFVPAAPVINPTIARCEREEASLEIEGLVQNALKGVYLL